MPQMDGFAVLDELRRQPEAAGIPIVVVTGETTLSTDEREQLANLDIIYKTDLQHDYDTFIEKVKQQIANYHGDA
jgi:CheY-like chemotaxis protein